MELYVLFLTLCVSSVVSYDPDMDLTTPQIIRRHGYSVESHIVLTDDGYLLTLHRITASPNRNTPHPTSPSSTTFFTTTPYSPPPPTTTTTTTSTLTPYTTTITTPTTNETTTTSTPIPTNGTTTTTTPTTNGTTTFTPPPTTTTSTLTPYTTTTTIPTTNGTTTTTTPTTTNGTTTTTTPTTNGTTTTTTPTTNGTTTTTTPTTTTTTTQPSPVVSSSPIFIQHGLLGSSADWILSGPGKALPYLLSDEGYDVWLGNIRGNVYSRAHVTLSTSDPKFWDFSWHEMAYYDIPACIDHVINVTGKSSVVYIGHSMGTTMFYAMAASRPEYNEKIRAMFSLAPVAYMGHVKSPIRLLAPFTRDLEYLFYLLGENQFLPQSKIVQLFAKYGCLLVATEKRICENIIFLLTGFDPQQFNMTLLPLVLRHTPAGTSTKTVLHYAQEIRSGKFQQYDHGTVGNWQAYNQSTPPQYNLSLITAPIELHYAKNDWLANTVDVDPFYQKLTNGIGKYLISFPEFNHVDFLWGKDARTMVYDFVIARIKQFSPPSLLEAKVPLNKASILKFSGGSMKEIFKLGGKQFHEKKETFAEVPEVNHVNNEIW